MEEEKIGIENIEINNDNMEKTNLQEENNFSQEKNNKKNKRKDACLFATGILATLAFVGVIILLCMEFCKKDNANTISAAPKAAIQNGDLKIAYIDTDSILLQYEYAKDLDKGLKSYQASLEANYQSTGLQLQKDIENYMKTGDKLTLTQQKQKEEELAKRQQDFPVLQQKMMTQLQERQLEDNKKLLNAVYAFIKDYNSKNQKFNIILSKAYVSSPILYADESFDITKEIIEGLNKEYKEVKK
ncbi:MAG: OmpH family outer membrane protein [Bacteroidales bacterium]|jgi:outer membrane protein|nr:OmpH family outer membrane protein [Bacteroidales bacterium]